MALGFMQQAAEPDLDPELVKALMGSDNDLNKSQGLFNQNQDMAKLVNTFLEEDLPADSKDNPLFKEFWAVLGKTIKLSFMEKEDIEDFESLFELARLDFMMSKPPYEFTFDDMKQVEQLRIYYLAACKRAMGFGSHRFNERIILGGSISQVIRSNTEAIRAGTGGEGFFSKLRKMF